MTLTRQNYVKEAEEVVKKLKTKTVKRPRKRKDGTKVYEESQEFVLTTSKIRNLLSMISEIYNDTLHNTGDKLSEECQERLQYLKMRFAYEAGREKENTNKGRTENSVEDLIYKAKIFEQIESIGDSKERCIIFCRYMESIVAYHKYYGGKDD